jgi:hypothetical protein
VVDQADDVARHLVAAIGGRVAGLVALAVAAQVERHRPVPLALESGQPAESPPVLVPVGGEAVDKDNGPHQRPCRDDVVIGEAEPAGLKGRHAPTVDGPRAASKPLA